MGVITIPYSPRGIFRPFHERRQRWSCEVAHRRAGKTVARINDLIRRAATCALPEPRFAYLAPTFTQAKDIAWSYVKRYTAPIPGVSPHEAELRCDLPNGARIRLYGAENYDRLRGIYLDGIVIDEYAQIDPRAWPEVIRPTLSDRKGWADFIGTPRGRNHFADLYEHASQNPGDWYCAMHKASETGLLDAAELADARKAMAPEQYEQEYECSFEAAMIGSYYGKLIAAAMQDGRITNVAYEPLLGVETWWDLGVNDATAIWFVQRADREVRVIDYYEHAGVGLDHYVKVLREKDYAYERHIAPFDIDVKELGSGRTRLEQAQSMGLRFRIAPNVPPADGINAVRTLLPACWFDRTRCKHGIDALRMYQKEWDDKRKLFNDAPLHDWTSHAADAFRYGALMQRGPATAFAQSRGRAPRTFQANTDFTP